MAEEIAGRKVLPLSSNNSQEGGEALREGVPKTSTSSNMKKALRETKVSRGATTHPKLL
jgi:hypothetical protein